MMILMNVILDIAEYKIINNLLNIKQNDTVQIN
jgi:hypothetical protein